MAQFRSTSDLVHSVLTRAGETISGTSPYDSNGDVLAFLNRVHFSIVAGGTIALGKDVTVEIDETWPWAKAKRPLVMELQPKITTGGVTLTLGSEAGTFSSGPSVSVAGWYLQVNGNAGIYRVASHTASATAFELDGAWPLASVSAGSFTLFKLDYDLVPDYIVIDETNNKIDFKKTSGGSELTATLTAGTYSPSALATHIGTQMTAATTGPTFTATYSSTTRLFTLATNGAGSTTLLPLFATGSNQANSAHGTLGFDDVDSAAATSHTGTYVLGGIARLIEPIRIGSQLAMGIDSESFTRDYPLANIAEGTPDRFTVIRENPDGSLRVRFNRYPTDKTRAEVDHVPVPRDLKDSAGSIPLVPRKWIDVLEDAATFYIMILKSDNRAPLFAQLAQGKLLAMVSQHRGQQLRSGPGFGQITPRRDLAARPRNLFGSEPY